MTLFVFALRAWWDKNHNKYHQNGTNTSSFHRTFGTIDKTQCRCCMRVCGLWSLFKSTINIWNLVFYSVNTYMLLFSWTGISITAEDFCLGSASANEKTLRTVRSNRQESQNREPVLVTDGFKGWHWIKSESESYSSDASTCAIWFNHV